ncbi:hypothetical protein FG386_002450 [Cryptosporidium ryanae]|uniref:uncharacterized protein n=1 Tax=Cryptosporidium ryanae TaxID=515981 RepID=UPI00351A663B|nr:hypothetical protein FG386_002450 [Cryptosporidium ryanae]
MFISLFPYIVSSLLCFFGICSAYILSSLPDLNTNQRVLKSSYDYIVVGGGAAGCALARTLADSKYSVLLVERGGTRFEESKLTENISGMGMVVDDKRVSQLVVTKQGVRTHIGNVLGGGTAINMGMIMQENPEFFDMLKNSSGAQLNQTLLEESYTWLIDKVSNKGDQNLPIVKPLENSFNDIGFVTSENPNSDFKIDRVNGTWRVYNVFNVSDHGFRMSSDILLSDYESVKKKRVIETSPVDILTHNYVTKIEFESQESSSSGSGSRLINENISFLQSKFSGINSFMNNEQNNARFTSSLKAKCILLNRNIMKSQYSDFNEHPSFNFTTGTITNEQNVAFKASKEILSNIFAKRICVNDNGMIILSSGAIHTPILLYKSGIGPRKALQNMNIMPILELPNLGTKIVDRMLFAIPLFYKENVSSNPFVNPLMSSFSAKSGDCGYSCNIINIESLGGGRTVEGTLYATRLIFPPELRNNIVTDFVIETFKSCAEAYPFSGIFPICLILQYPLKCLRRSAAVFYFTSEPKSRGSLSVNNDGKFELDANYLSDDEDKENVITGLSSVIKMLRSGKFDDIAEPGGYSSCPLTVLNGIIGVLASAKTEGLFMNKPFSPEFMRELENVYNNIVEYKNTLFPEECLQNENPDECFKSKNIIFENIATFPPALPDISDKEAVLNLAFKVGTSIWHWAGSAPLGELVENDIFTLSGTSNLGVVDASLLKIIPRINPVFTIMSLGRYAGISILKNREKKQVNNIYS